MNCYDSKSWESLWEPVVQTWETPRTRYSSPFEYTCDPVATKTVQLWDSQAWDRESSSRKKSYYQLSPYYAQFPDITPLESLNFGVFEIVNNSIVIFID